MSISLFGMAHEDAMAGCEERSEEQSERVYTSTSRPHAQLYFISVSDNVIPRTSVFSIESTRMPGQ